MRRRRSTLASLASNPAFVAGVIILAAIALAALLAPVLFPDDPQNMVSSPLSWPGTDADYPLGTDSLGRDIAAGLVHGARVSLLVGLSAAAIGLVIGTIVGAVGGYFGGWLDTVTARITEAGVQTIPSFLLVLVLVAIFSSTVRTIALAIGLASWPLVARLVRAQFRSLRDADFVMAARSLGYGTTRIILGEILPNALPPVIVTASVLVANAILTEAGLAFLGMGDPNLVSWGSMIGDGRALLRTEWFVAAIPGLRDCRHRAGAEFGGRWAERRAEPAVRLMSLLEVHGLQVGFGTTRVVRGIDFTIEAGETLALVGESGCGKSMTAFALMQLLPPGAAIQGGTIRFEGQALTGLPARALRQIRGNRIGLVLQEPMTALNPVRSIGSQVAEAILQHQSPARPALRARILELLDRVGIVDPAAALSAYPHTFSGGMRQRVMIAIAVACNPALLIADEPTTALDVTIQAQILELLARLQREMGMALLLITHDLGVVQDWADRVAVMYAGRIVEQGPAAAVLGQPGHPYARGLLGAAVGVRHYTQGALTEIVGTVASAAAAPGCPFAPRCPLHLPACDASVPPLHDVDGQHEAACIRAPEWAS